MIEVKFDDLSFSEKAVCYKAGSPKREEYRRLAYQAGEVTFFQFWLGRLFITRLGKALWNTGLWRVWAWYYGYPTRK